MGDTHPKVFISYSWTSSDYEAIVLGLAERLVKDGIEVVLDKWDLHPGHEMNWFMERCVNDDTIDKVLILCDKAYAEKADNRQGGVGKETRVISSHIDSVVQEKFIPIVMERGEDGEAYLPAYLKPLLYIDFSGDGRESNYDDLVRDIYGIPKYTKPMLGESLAFGGGDDIVRVSTIGMPIELSTKSFAEYSWSELKTIADEIAAASEFEWLQVALKYRLG